MNSPDGYFLKKALSVSKHCIINPDDKTDNKFGVGCVIVKGGKVVSTGFTGEEPFNAHAEDTALRKAKVSVAGATLYSTMEPCSVSFSRGIPHALT